MHNARDGCGAHALRKVQIISLQVFEPLVLMEKAAGTSVGSVRLMRVGLGMEGGG